MTETQPNGRALVLAAASARDAIRSQLLTNQMDSEFADDPYRAVAILFARPLAFRAVVISLQSLYRSELILIKVIRERVPHLDVILTHTDGRAAALAEAMRLGATELLGEDGLHRISDPPQTNPHDEKNPENEGSSEQTEPIDPNADDPIDLHSGDSEDETHSSEPILTADELRALLQDSNVEE